MPAAAVAQFNYQVRDKAGKLINGSLEAESQGAVASKLRSMGYAPIRIEQVEVNALSREIHIPGFGPKVKGKDLAIFSRQFATMINSGLSLLRALSILAEQTENPALSKVINEIAGDIEVGKSLSQSLAAREKVFPKLYIAMVRAGETAGMLDAVLLRIADTLEADLALRGKIKAALTYPVIVFILAILLTAVMLVFIVPTFVSMFESFDAELPLPTRVLMMLSQFLTSPVGGLITFVMPFTLWQLFKKVRENEKGRYQLDRMKLKLPVFGSLFHKIAITRFSRNLGTLMRAGVPILQALEITADTVDNGPIATALKEVQEAVSEGESIARPLKNHPIFPPMVVQMIAVGEETGAIDTMLEKIAEFYDQEVSSQTESLTALMEPLMIAVLGGLVGGMVIALYMPIFKIISLVDG